MKSSGRIHFTVSFAFEQTIEYFSFLGYCYRLERNGQSVSRDSRVKHLDETLSIYKKLCNFYEVQGAGKNENLSLLLNLIATHYATALHTLLLLPITSESLLKICDYEKKIMNGLSNIFDAVLENERTPKEVGIWKSNLKK